MNYCYECGAKLILRELKNEGMIPFCCCCNTYRFPIFSTAVSMIVQNPAKDKILLIQQYGQKTNILVAGYVNKGENAETTVAREVKEEIGLNVSEIQFNRSEYFPKTNTLMLNFSCVADSEALSGVNTEEVDTAEWFSFQQAKEKIRPESLAKRFLLDFLSKQH